MKQALVLNQIKEKRREEIGANKTLPEEGRECFFFLMPIYFDSYLDRNKAFCAVGKYKSDKDLKMCSIEVGQESYYLEDYQISWVYITDIILIEEPC